MLGPIPIVDKVILDLEKTRMDDLVDRAHYMFTVMGLVFAMLIIGAKQIFGDPIRCMVAAEYPGGWVNYVNEYCFITSTFVGNNGNALYAEDMFDTERRMDISYYQWVPYTLLAMAVFFYMPHFVWSRCQDTADIDFRVVVDESMKVRSELKKKKRKESIGRIVDYMKQTIFARQSMAPWRMDSAIRRRSATCSPNSSRSSTCSSSSTCSARLSDVDAFTGASRSSGTCCTASTGTRTASSLA